jgi:hypothetical protein
MRFEPLGLAGTREFGTLSEYVKLGESKTRPFNKITVNGDTVAKEPLDEQGQTLAMRESNWYRFAGQNKVAAIPNILGFKPLTMEHIAGANVYETAASEEVLGKIVAALEYLHAVKNVPADAFSLHDAYFGKTMARLDKIRTLVPFTDERMIVVNGRVCHNVFFRRRAFEKLLDGLRCERFTFIHGDCTFSNIMLRQSGDRMRSREPVFIDPRGYFGHTELFGDPNYDFAKLYYSIVGNYDRFNLKDFRLTVSESAVELTIASNGWEGMAQTFFKLSGADERTIKLIHAVIWLSLTTYAWQDYDSICGAFYNGLYHLEECWEWNVLNGR